MPYPVGTEIRFSVVFKNADGVEADPTAVTFRIKQNSETLFTYGTDAALVRTAPGRYAILYAPAAAGSWVARWKGTGAVNAASSDVRIVVDATDLTP
jgi:hypothetical protein